ncbi:hypothetical protein [Alishewanella longhuensis]
MAAEPGKMRTAAQPYAARSGQDIVLASLEGLEDQTRDENGLRAGDYYLCPKDNRRRCVVGPYLSC